MLLRWVGAVVAVLGLTGVALAQSVPLPSPKPKPAKKVTVAAKPTEAGEPLKFYKEFRELDEAEKKIIGAAIARGLKDPESARFRWSKLPVDNGSVGYCSMVNAKNSFGGYVGFRPYLAVVLVKDNRAAGASVVGIGSSDDDAKAVEKVCAQHNMNPYSAI